MRVTLLDIYLLRQLAIWSTAGFAVIFSVTFLERTLRLATQMAAMGAHMRFVPAMAWNLAPHYVALGLPDAFLIGMLVTLSRLDDDLEIEAMLASGFSLTRVLGGMIAAAVVTATVNLAFVGWMEPLGLYGYRVERARAVEAGWRAEVQAWTFNSRAGDVMLTADRVDAAGQALTGVFVRRRSPGGTETVATARSGRLGLDERGLTPTLDLADGVVLLQRPGKAPIAGAFSRYSLTDPYTAPFQVPPRSGRPVEMTLNELAQAPTGAERSRSELVARLARTAVLPILPFLALPLAMAGRRRRIVGLAAAGLLALLFRQSVRLTQRLGESGRVDPTLAMAGVFLVFVVLTFWIFAANRRLHGDTILARVLGRVGAAFERRKPAASSSPRITVAGYLQRVVGQAILAAWAVLVVLLTMIDCFERTGDIFEHGFGLAGVVRYGVLRAPSLALMSLGLATAIGAAAAFGRLDRTGEIVAIRALGVSLPGMARALAPVGVGLVLIAAALNELVIPTAQLALANWWGGSQGEQWFRAGHTLLLTRGLSPDGAAITGLSVFVRDKEGRLVTRTDAPLARFEGGAWRLREAAGLRISASAPNRDPQLASFAFSPRDLAAAAAAPADTAAVTAWKALYRDAPTNLSRGYLLTRLHRALAAPLAPLVALVLALPLAIAPARNGPGAQQVAWVLGVTLLYVVVDGLFTAAGLTSLAPPWLAAWAAPLLFGAVAVNAFGRAEL